MGKKWSDLGTPAKVGLIGVCTVLVVGGIVGGVAITNTVELADAHNEFTAAQHTYQHDVSADSSRTALLATAITKATALSTGVAQVVSQGSGFVGATQLATLSKAEKQFTTDLAVKSPPAVSARTLEDPASPSAPEYKRLTVQQHDRAMLVSARTSAIDGRLKTLDSDTTATMAALLQVAGSVPATSAAVFAASTSATSATQSTFTATAAALKAPTASTVLARLTAYLGAAAALKNSNTEAVAAAQAAASAASAQAAQAAADSSSTSDDSGDASSGTDSSCDINPGDPAEGDPPVTGCAAYTLPPSYSNPAGDPGTACGWGAIPLPSNAEVEAQSYNQSQGCTELRYITPDAP
jgi:hypothetical protein